MLLCLLLRLDVDSDDQVLHLLAQRILDTIADRMGLSHRHCARHHQVKIQEGQPAGIAHAEVVSLDRAGSAVRHQFASIRPPTELEIIIIPDHST